MLPFLTFICPKLDMMAGKLFTFHTVYDKHQPFYHKNAENALQVLWWSNNLRSNIIFTKFFIFPAYNGNGTETYRYLCNHRRAYKFFTDSISPKCYFTAFPCESYDKFEKNECFACGNNGQECGRLGYYSNLSKGRGNLYLMTRDGEPFCGKFYILNNLIFFLHFFFFIF